MNSATDFPGREAMASSISRGNDVNRDCLVSNCPKSLRVDAGQRYRGGVRIDDQLMENVKVGRQNIPLASTNQRERRLQESHHSLTRDCRRRATSVFQWLRYGRLSHTSHSPDELMNQWEFGIVRISHLIES
jgi:hypothetical protein